MGKNVLFLDVIRSKILSTAASGFTNVSANKALYLFRYVVMSEEVYEKFSVEDITEETIGMDFKVDPNIHKCYLIKNKVKVHVPTKKLIKKKS